MPVEESGKPHELGNLDKDAVYLDGKLGSDQATEHSKAVNKNLDEQVASDEFGHLMVLSQRLTKLLETWCRRRFPKDVSRKQRSEQDRPPPDQA